MRTLLTNCPNCGGVLTGNKCEYCGTHVRYANEVDIDFKGKPIELVLNIKQGDTVTVLPMVGRINTVEVRSDTYNLCNCDGSVYRPIVAAREVEFNFTGIINEGVLGNDAS